MTRVRTKSEENVGTEGRPLQHGPHWREDYCELKAFQTLWPQEKILPLP